MLDRPHDGENTKQELAGQERPNITSQQIWAESVGDD